MNFKRIVVITCILLAIFTMGAVSASDINDTSDSLTVSDDDSLDTNFDSDILADGSDKTFSDLNTLIEGSDEGSEVKLEHDYTFNSTSDSGFSNGISISKSLTIDGQGHTINANYSARIFDASFVDLVLKNISFVNARCDGDGGAIRLWSGSVSNCSFENCSSAANGGAVCHNNGDDVEVLDCSFENCSSAANGGAVSIGGNVSGCSFVNCSVVGSQSEVGGGICCADNGGSIINCSFENCYCSNSWGSAAVADNVSGCSFVNCWGDHTGAVNADGNVFNCTFEGCYSLNSRAGAVYCNGNVFNCSFANSRALGDVGGAVGSDGTCNVFNCSFENCYATNYGGAVGINYGNVSCCSFVNCSTSPTGEGGAIVIFYGGLISDCNFSDCSAKWGGAITGGESDISGCSFLRCSASENGGAINGNFNVSGCSFSDCSANWAGAIDGNGVISDCNFTNCYAVEGNGAIYGDCNVSGCSFVDCSSDGGCGAINGNGVFSNCNFTNCSAAHAGAIGTGNAAISGCSFVDCSAPNGNGGAIKGENFTISNSVFINCSANFGGTIANGGNSSILNCSFTNCSANSHGGAIFSDCSYILVDGCNFTDCHADDSGGALVIPESNKYSAVSDCSFANCSSCLHSGAISWQGGEGKLSGCIFVNCSALGSEGGAIRSECRNLTIENSIFINNSADMGNGGALCLVNRTSIVNSTFEANHADEGNAIWAGDGTNVTFTSNSFRLKKGESRNSLIYGVKQDVLKASEIYNDGRMVVTPDIDIDYSDLVLGQNQTVRVALPGDATGSLNITLLLNGKVLKNVTCDLNEGKALYEFSNLNFGVYNITVSYSGDENYYDCLESVVFMVRPAVYISEGATVGDDVLIFMDLVDATNRIKIYLDGEEFLIHQIKDNRLNCTLATGELYAKSYNVSFEYLGSSFDKDIFKCWDKDTRTFAQFNYTFSLEPIKVTVDDKMGSDNAGVVVIELPENATGTIDVFIDGVRVQVVELVNGIARIDLSQFKDGSYKITFAYSGDERYSAFTKDVVTDVRNDVPASIVAGDVSVVYLNSKTYSVNVLTKTGKGVSGVEVSFLVNGKLYGTARTNANGVASISITSLPGSYQLTSRVSSLSAVKTLSVTHLVSLKKVNVKKSAKKLVLTASLAKVNGKFLKSKKVTFKFNGKKYTSKTNKKGVAKGTVKSSVLKKLKVGKKVKYQATYLKDTVSYSIKVKK